MAKNIYGGGSNTNKHGLKFEQDTRLETSLINAGFFIKGVSVHFDEIFIGKLLPKHKLYKNFLTPAGVDYKKYISKQLLPDDALFVSNSNTIFIIEKKFQNSSGSVDEKLQTCDFKKKQYTKLFDNKYLHINVEYIYVLSDWFKDDSYKDVLDYIESVGCHYYFNEIPLKVLGLNIK